MLQKIQINNLKHKTLMVKKQLFSSDYAQPAIVEIAVRVEAGFAASDQFENIGDKEADTEF